MQMDFSKKQSGFTLIEMIVSLGVFSIVVTTAVGAMLMLIANNQRLQAEQSVMTNLAFAIDTMTREIRTGYSYYCAERPGYGGSPSPSAIFESGGSNHENLGDTTANCPGGRTGGSPNTLQGVSFIEGGDSITGSASRILYFFDRGAGDIMRKVGNNPPQSIVSSGLHVVDAEFTVTGSETLSALGSDTEQPTVTIFIQAAESPFDPTSSKIYTLQTTVTQRSLDI
jgi:prepilin-type N-terminal cleavage/methylation domain-containing protein